MDGSWQIDINPDVRLSFDGERCVIGGIVSVAFSIEEIEFVWHERAEAVAEPRGMLELRLKDRPGTLAAVRLNRGEAVRLRLALESGSPTRH
jgi:hypothetical protein